MLYDWLYLVVRLPWYHDGKSNVYNLSANKLIYVQAGTHAGLRTNVEGKAK